MVRALRADTRPLREHAFGRFAEGNGDDALALRQPLAGAQEERHAGPAPIVDRAFQRDEGLGIGLGVDAGLGTVARVLPAHDMLRIDRQHAAKDLVFFLADGPRRQRRRWLHRHERENLEQVGDHHVAIRPGRLVEGGTRGEPERLGNVNLHMIDEVAVPDRLEQPVGEAECEDVLRWLLAQEVVDAEVFCSARLRLPAAWPHDQEGERWQRKIAVNGNPVASTDQLFWAGYASRVYLPATVGPAGLAKSGLPVGYQAIAASGRDKTATAFSRFIEKEIVGFTPPPGFD